MWTRKELKTKGKTAFLANYWKTLLASLILLILVGGSSVGRGFANKSGSKKDETAVETQVQDESFSESMSDAFSNGRNGNYYSAIKQFTNTLSEETAFSYSFTDNKFSGFAAFLITVIAVLLLAIAISVSLAVNAFLINPLEVGCKRFFTRNLNQKARVSELAYSFDNNYMNIVKTCFLRDIYVLLWALLLIIPGIIKKYEYRMIPYLLADHPEMSREEAFARSKELMKGQKWNAFVLDLSFLGWEILSALTLMILGIFYVAPYRNMTNAALYEKLEYGSIAIEEQ